MNRLLSLLAFALGLAVMAWIAAGYVGSSPLALAMTALITAVYLMGGLELRRFHLATTSLQQALATLTAPVPSLGEWLRLLHPSLQNSARARIEGERVGLPGPVMTPYLVGLLVLLGMLGTFLGMVVTLNGAVLALESTTDLPTIRAALAAPVKGLGLAFGTSVAGVAGSAMLGLVSALCRRERLQAAQWLDTQIATHMRAHSLAHQREATLEAVQAQARLLPAVVDQLQALSAQMALQGEHLNQRLLTSQDHFHQQAQASYTALAASVDQSLQHSLREGARLAGATLQPVVEATMAGLARESSAFQTQVAHTVAQQMAELTDHFGQTVGTVADTWRGALAEHQRSNGQWQAEVQTSLANWAQGFEQRSTALLASVEGTHAALQHTVTDAHTALQAAADARDQQRQADWSQSLASMASTLQREWQAAGTQALARQQAICQTLESTAQGLHTQAETHARNTIAEVARLVETAAEAPRAAAQVIGALREQLSDSMARDNGLLDERARIMGTLATLLDTVNAAATEQRSAIDGLVGSAAKVLQQVGQQFNAQIEAESHRMSDAATQIAAGAVEVASLGEAFGAAVQSFSDSSEALAAHLQRIEAALSQSTTRSDEQLGYYVAQAREIIDLSISSQKLIVDDLKQLAIRQTPQASEAA